MQSLSWSLANYILQTIQQINKALRKKKMCPYILFYFWWWCLWRDLQSGKSTVPLCRSGCSSVVDDRRRPPSMNSMNFMNIPKTTHMSSAHKINIHTMRLHAKYSSASLSADLYDKTHDLLYLLISHPLILSAFSSAWCPWYPQVLHNDGAQRF